MHPMLNIAKRAAFEAGKVILQAMDHLSGVTVDEKKKHDFVTEVDKTAESIIIEAIKKAYPSHAILGEESGLQGESDTVWIIDPLDGTTNFIHGYPHFSLSIAIKEKGKLLGGLIYDPIRDECFSASKGSGAYLNQTRLRVTDRQHLDNALLGTGFPFKQPEKLDQYLDTFKALFPQSAGIRRAGSAALDLAYVAAGRLDGFWEYDLKPWDIAAGVLLIKEAGGLVLDFDGGEGYFDHGNVVAGNPKMVKAMLKALR